MGISYEIEVVTIAIDEATSDDHCHFNQVCPVKKCAERSEFFAYFLVSVLVFGVSLGSLVSLA